VLIKSQNLVCNNLEQYVYVCARSPTCVKGGWGRQTARVVMRESV